MIYNVYVGVGLVGCDKVVAEIDSEDFMCDEMWADMTYDEQQDMLSESAWEAAQEHFEVWTRETE